MKWSTCTLLWDRHTNPECSICWWKIIILVVTRSMPQRYVLFCCCCCCLSRLNFQRSTVSMGVIYIYTWLFIHFLFDFCYQFYCIYTSNIVHLCSFSSAFPLGERHKKKEENKQQPTPFYLNLMTKLANFLPLQLENGLCSLDTCKLSTVRSV